METSSASTLRKVCPQCSTTVHVRRAVCGCGYAFPSKRRARPDSVSQAILAEGLHFSALVYICKGSSLSLHCFQNDLEKFQNSLYSNVY